MIQLAWRFLMFQKESALALWYRARTTDSRIGTRKTMIVALTRKLIIALWRFGVGTPARFPVSTSAFLSHSFNVWRRAADLLGNRNHAAHRDGCSASWSRT